MRAPMVCVVAFLATTATVLPAQDPPVARFKQTVDAAHAGGTFDGVVVITQHGRTVFTEAVGASDRAARRAFVPEARFRLASLTKQVTALLVLQEVERKTMRLDQPVAELLPGLSSATGRVTVRQLLQHISGLPNPSAGPDDEVPKFYLKTDVDAGYLERTATGFCSGVPVRAPDEKFEYNNCDYLVLGAALERVTGLRYANLLRARVTAPLGLRSWGMFAGDGRRPVVVKGYGADGALELPQNAATYAAAGGLYGNALDVATWNTALLTNKLLTAESTALLFKGERNLGGEALGSWSYDLPGTSPALHLVERQGDIGGTRVLSLLLPQQDASIVILANTEKADLFNTYSQKGLGFALVKAFTGR